MPQSLECELFTIGPVRNQQLVIDLLRKCKNLICILASVIKASGQHPYENSEVWVHMDLLCKHDL